MTTHEQACNVIVNGATIVGTTMTLALSEAFESLGDQMAEAFQGVAQAMAGALAGALGGEASPRPARPEAKSIESRIREELQGPAIDPERMAQIKSRLTPEAERDLVAAARTHLTDLPDFTQPLTTDQFVACIALGLANDARLAAFTQDFMRIGNEFMGPEA